MHEITPLRLSFTALFILAIDDLFLEPGEGGSIGLRGLFRLSPITPRKT